MSSRLKRILLLLTAAALLIGNSFTQKAMNHDRETLGLTHAEPLENAPPVLAFTTVALGGFRGLIANFLWMRAQQLQDDDKFFEMQQLADWITKLEPRFPQVWANQAWNMSYNISVKFKDPEDRWRWVKAGIELLRDKGIQYNPDAPLIYRELGWQFQHKMGANLDDANMYYKREWAKEMTDLFGGDKPKFDELINPQTDEQKERAELLRDKYKMDPAFMKEVDERYGPLEWRLPEAHAIYWGALGLKKAAEFPEKVKADDLPQLRRVIYQSMQLAFYRGRLVRNPFMRGFEFGPDLAIFPKVYDAYEEMIREEPDPGQKSGFRRAERNVIKDAVYFYYVQNRIADAEKWYQVLLKKYPNDQLLDNDPKATARTLTLDEYAVARVQGDVVETDRNRIKGHLEGLLVNAYQSLALNEDDAAAGYRLLAQKVWERYQKSIGTTSNVRIGLPPLDEIAKEVLDGLLDPQEGMPFEARAVLRTKLGMEAEPAPSPAATNDVPATTNAPAEGP